MCSDIIANIHNCYGCGVCAVSCPKQIIGISLNSEGFYEPKIEHDEICINCGRCLEVCSYINDEIAVKKSYPMACYAAWSNDEDVRRLCSSGGVGFELVKTSISHGCKVMGVKYDALVNRAAHYISETLDEAEATIGSKYIQSYTVDGIRAIDRKEKYLVTGTPCQIDSFRRYIRKLRCEDNYLLMDFFCHGVPSMWLWTKYINEIKKITGSITEVSWRNKAFGWHDSWNMNIHGEISSISRRWSHGDLFYKMFLSNSCLGKACYKKCKFKGTASSADIRIGDLWGKTYKNEEKGVNSVVVFTEKGHEALKQSNCQLKCHPYEIVAEAQMEKHLKEPLTRGLICKLLATSLPLKIIFVVVQFTRISYLLKCKIEKLRKR